MFPFPRLQVQTKGDVDEDDWAGTFFFICLLHCQEWITPHQPALILRTYTYQDLEVPCMSFFVLCHHRPGSCKTEHICSESVPTQIPCHQPLATEPGLCLYMSHRYNTYICLIRGDSELYLSFDNLFLTDNYVRLPSELR